MYSFESTIKKEISMSDSIYKDFSNLLFSIYSKSVELENESKGSAVAGTLGILRDNDIITSFGVLNAISYNSKEITFKDSKGNELKVFKNEDVPEPTKKKEFVDFLEMVLKDIAYK